MIIFRSLLKKLKRTAQFLKNRPFKIVFLLILIFLLVGFKTGNRFSGVPVANWIAGNLMKIEPADQDAFSFAVFGDNQKSRIVFPALLQQIDRDADILFTMGLGDFVSHGRRSEYRYFFEQLEDNLKLPMLPVIGNHETHGEDRKLYEELFGMLYYSFQIGNSYFIVIDNADRGEIGLSQKIWLGKELQKATAYEHRFVFMHYPLYNPLSETHQPFASQKSTDGLMFLFKEYKVDHIFAAHIHGSFSGQWQNIPFSITGGAGGEMPFTDVDHFYYHYLKVIVKGGKIDVKVQPVILPDHHWPNYFQAIALPKLLAFMHFHGIELAVLLLTAWTMIIFMRWKTYQHQ
jgi:hypothetical protein